MSTLDCLIGFVIVSFVLTGVIALFMKAANPKRHGR